MMIIRSSVLLATAGIFLSIGAGTTAAQAGTSAQAHMTAAANHSSFQRPETPSCSSARICFWQDNSFGGTEDSIATANFHSQWDSFSNAGISFHPGSTVNGSNSAIYLWDEAGQVEECVPGNASNSDLNKMFGFFFISFGVSDCGGVTPPPPPS